tara:strand:+ start:168 stop:497 length:330 start_codon:yes stop_codon:yes gene_type:complete
MMAKRSIPDEVKKEAAQIIDRFNEEILSGSDCFYIPRYRGSYLYLNRNDAGTQSSICRLKYTGDMQNWEFAIFKYSSETYDPEEWIFPGSGFIDGTIEGAMKAGMEAYP